MHAAPDALTDVPRLCRLLGLVQEEDVPPVEAGLHAAAQNHDHLQDGIGAQLQVARSTAACMQPCACSGSLGCCCI